MTKYTADFCDSYPDKVTVLGPGYAHYGGIQHGQGEIVTVQLDRNNADLITLLRDCDGKGKVAVVDSAQAYYAIVGENLMKFAHSSGYAGIILNGYIRDIEQIQDIPVALYALGTCPRKYIPVTQGKLGVDLSFGGVTFHPGDRVWIDGDGVIVSAESLE
ncbi:MAG: putative 4-hydroxy-4-methyl-2-oxoglutarate aldolase [Granulosicoccus sp.]|nr:putative 4-hydroxy-4-methyl-2-oxoglutarate aldolase [Granulosicoccus sp.]